MPTSSGDHLYVFYRALATDPWQDYALASGTISVTAPPVISVTAPTGSASYNAGDSLPVAWSIGPRRHHGPVHHLAGEPGQQLVLGDTVTANPSSTSYADNVTLNVPTGSGYHRLHLLPGPDHRPLAGLRPGVGHVLGDGGADHRRHGPDGHDQPLAGAPPPVTWTTDSLVPSGQFTIWIVSCEDLVPRQDRRR